MQDRVESFIRDADARCDQDFEELALQVFADQYDRHPSYQRLCRARGGAPDRVQRWQDIPAAPADIFKEPAFTQVHSSVNPDDRMFRSSGTTRGPDHRSLHAVGLSLSTYHLAAMAHFDRMVCADRPGPLRTLILGPTQTSHPQSSLGQMFSWCGKDFGDGPAATSMDAEGVFDLDHAVRWLIDSAADTGPVLILAISSALTSLFQTLRTRSLRLRLPADSRVVDTGGNKGVRAFSAAGLRKAAWTFLHVPSYNCVNEYGMTELFSQFYDDALMSRHDGSLLPRSKVGPGWTRTIVVDPTTLTEVPCGESGLLCHLDLANWESIVAVQTSDIGRRTGRGFELLGRAPQAQQRGCSALLASMRSDNAASDPESV